MLSSANHVSFNRTQETAQLYARQLSSAKRVNSAADDAAGLAVINAMTSQLNGQNQASSNITNGLSLVDTAGGALGQVTDNLQRMRELAVQAGNGTLNDSDRQSIQDEMTQLSGTLDSIAGNAQFNGQNLLDGSFSGQFQVGPNGDNRQSITLGSVTSSDLGLSGLSVSNSTDASDALQRIESAIQNIGSQQSNVGGVAAGLNSSLSNINSSYAQLAAARSRISDTDYAQASSGASQAAVQANVASYAQKLYSDIQKSTTLGLLS